MKNGDRSAFPVNIHEDYTEGLTKREWMATRFMGGFLHALAHDATLDPSGSLTTSELSRISACAKAATTAADILLAELERKE